MTDVEKLAGSFEEKMSSGVMVITDKCCIFRTPNILSRHNKKAYIPNGFSIGPFHHHLSQTVTHPQETITHPEKTLPNFKLREKLKHKYMEELISRAADEKAKQELLRSCINVVKEIAGEAREYYEGDIGLSDDQFLEMLVLDGCFLVELFRRQGNVVNRGRDPVCAMACLQQYLSHDLILLENQLPWPVLDRLFTATQHTQIESRSLIQLVLEFFSNVFSSDKLSADPTPFANKDIKHILDLLRLSLVMKFEESKVKQDTVGWAPFPTGTTLRESGIKFSRVNSTSILDIDFKNGVLEMPNLLIQETTETIFRNLISFEQCYPDCHPRVTCYAMLLDNLINTSKDMAVLCENGIIDNWVNPEDATEFFRKLYQDAYVKSFYYQELCVKVNDYRRRWWPSWQAFFRQNYLDKPWALVSLLAAIFLLILSVLQTIFGIIGK